MTYLNSALRLSILSAVSMALMACSAGGDGPRLEDKSTTPETAATIAERTAAEIADMKPMEILDVVTKDANRLADTLSTVKDEASARAASAELKAMGPRLEAMGKHFETMDKSDFSLSLNTLSKMQDAGKAQLRFAQEMGRISNDHPELLEFFKDEFGDMELKLQ